MSKLTNVILEEQEFRNKEICINEPKEEKIIKVASNYPEGINRFNPPWND